MLLAVCHLSLGVNSDQLWPCYDSDYTVHQRHLWNIARILQPYKPEDRQGAVNKIKCCDCQASYIGETGRNLSMRLTEHKRAPRNGDVNNHIAEHHLQKKHQIDWDSATCITYSTDYYQRLTLVSWFTTDYRTGCRNVSHCQQQHVLFRTTFTRTIKLNLLLKWLLGSNLSQDYKYCSEE